MKIILTGASGFLGSSLLRDLSIAGHEVIGLTRMDADLMSLDQIRDQFSKHQPDAVVHAAGLVGGIQANIAHNYEFLLNNTMIGFNLVAAALEFKIQNFLNFSSSCVYPPEGKQPFLESQILTGSLERTNEGYALAKINVQKLLGFASKQFELNFKTIIPSNLYGPGDNFNPDSSHMLAAAIMKVKNARDSGQSSVKIWGDGSARREFTFIGDLTEWVSREAVNVLAALPESLNVGCGEDYSIKEFYETVAEVLGFNGGFEFDVNQPSGMKRKIMDSSAAAAFGWQSQTTLPDGIRLTAKWMEQNVK